MTETKTVTVRITHGSSIPGACWCQPVGWEPSNEIEGASFIDGSWYDDESDISAPEVAGIVWFGDIKEYDEYDNDELIIECSLDDLRIASCGECRVIGVVTVDDDDEFGDLIDYYTGETIRPATKAERDASRAAGPEGVILVDADGRILEACDSGADDARRCYVQE